MNVWDFAKTMTNATVFDSFVKCDSVLRRYNSIMCAISGGSDSDILIDMLQKTNYADRITYVWFDTGLEYQATKEHLNFLESKYNITIERMKAKKPVPVATREYGQPFLSKRVSNLIERLQKHGFKWENEDFETLCDKYPKCKAALRWWCNDFGENSRFNISYNKYLKEFMIANPPTFKISDKCCEWAKKKVAKNAIETYNAELNVYGVRRSEGGARSTAYKSCWDKIASEYRPIFWYDNDDKEYYVSYFGVTNSRCYSEYGLRRTGCAGCPFGRDFEKELEIIAEHEPKLLKAVNKIFKDSYKYTREYKDFVRQMNGD